MSNSVLLRPTLVGRTSKWLLAFALAILSGGALLAGAMTGEEDPVKVDARHYKVELENDSVRVLRVKYGPHEKSVMHYHPANVAVFLSDGQARFTLPGGKTQDVSMKAGTVAWATFDKHLPENIGDKPFEVILIELKAKRASVK
jgi:quercetin dioxygenase-like cupin family protein